MALTILILFLTLTEDARGRGSAFSFQLHCFGRYDPGRFKLTRQSAVRKREPPECPRVILNLVGERKTDAQARLAKVLEAGIDGGPEVGLVGGTRT